MNYQYAHKRGGLRAMWSVAVLIVGMIAMTACSGGISMPHSEPDKKPTLAGDGWNPAAPVIPRQDVKLVVTGAQAQSASIAATTPARNSATPQDAVRVDEQNPHLVIVSTSKLRYATDYQVSVVTHNYDDGYGKPNEEQKLTFQFSTITPKNKTLAIIKNPNTIGIGSLVSVHFDEPITFRKRAVNRLSVINRTTGEPVAGAWRWTSSQDVQFRPDSFWADHSSFYIRANIYGLELAPGMYGQENTSGPTFTTGSRWLVTINNASKRMAVWKDHKIVRVIPVSLGKPGHDTPNGIYVVGEKNPSMIMDSSTYGVSSGPEAYRLKVDWATQISYSGIYVHAAPWSVYAQGNTNTSHGCVNVTDALGQWFQQTVPVGTPVIVRNTNGGILEATDGLGYWNQSGKQFSQSNGA